MARVRVPSNVVAMTLVDSGSVAPDANHIITCSAAEATLLCQSYSQPRPKFTNNFGSGAMIIWQPGCIAKCIDVNDSIATHNFTAEGTLSNQFIAADANPYIYEGFHLVSG